MRVEIYGTKTCTYCKQAVSLCESKAIEYNYTDVSAAEELEKLTERMGIRPRTVPQIFLNGMHLPDGFNGLEQELAKN